MNASTWNIGIFRQAQESFKISSKFNNVKVYNQTSFTDEFLKSSIFGNKDLVQNCDPNAKCDLGFFADESKRFCYQVPIYLSI